MTSEMRSWRRRLLILSLATITTLASAAMSSPASGQSPTAAPNADNADNASRVFTAARIATPPRIDGREDDDAWRNVPVTREFVMFTPEEGGKPTLATEARIAYDDHALYVLVRAFDPHPDSIVRRLARRDTDDQTADEILLFIDPYHDRRTGYEFFATAGGVKSDALIYDDSEEDNSWDGVWDVATRIDSLGWVAEFAIPFRLLRFGERQHPAFGFTIGRWVGRSGERMSFPQYRPSSAGLASQLGTLSGLRDLARPAGIEAMPYVLARGDNGRPLPGRSASTRTTRDMGLDLEWRPRANVSLDATVNPDFGQVEADSAALDLSGTELFQEERRPFFVEGAGMLTFPFASDEPGQLFHSRRIGRPPAFGEELGGTHPPIATTILGAMKTTARLTPSTSFAGLGALTDAEWGEDRMDGSGRYLVEPRARFGVARLQRDFRAGRSGIGMMATAMSRETPDSLTRATLVGRARSAALTSQHQSADGVYQISGWGAVSTVEGDSAAIARTQLSTVHAFQRPDDHVAFDPSRRRLSGSAGALSAGKISGTTRIEASYRWISPGFDVNEVGYLTTSGAQTATLNVGLDRRHPGRLLGVRYRNASAYVRVGGDWSSAGLPYARQVRLATAAMLPDQSKVSLTLSTELAGAYCAVACTRGGPAVVDPPSRSMLLDFTTDRRRALVSHASVKAITDDEGRSGRRDVQLDVQWRVRGNFDVRLAAYEAEWHDAAHFYERVGDPTSDTARYMVARLDEATRSFSARLDYTFTPTLTMQWNAQTYLARGGYTDGRTVANPRARDWDVRFQPLRDPFVGQRRGIDFGQLRSQAVVRWEYRPGSTTFLVWSQGRDVDADRAGSMRLWPGRDLNHLFRRYPSNTVALKAVYWIGR